MIYPAIAIANAFIKKAMIGEIQNLTPMKLQKLMFLLNLGIASSMKKNCLMVLLNAGNMDL